MRIIDMFLRLRVDLLVFRLLRIACLIGLEWQIRFI